MSGKSIGNGFKEYRTTSLLQHLSLTLDCIYNRKGIVTIHALGVHGVRIHSCTHSGKHVKSHGLPGSLTTHAVEIIHEVEDNWQSSAQRFIPKLMILPHPSKVHGFPSGSAPHGGVADIGNNETIPAIDLLEQGGTSCYVGRTAHDRIVRKNPERSKERMHGTTKATIKPGSSSKDFRQGSVEKKIPGQILYATSRGFLFYDL